MHVIKIGSRYLTSDGRLSDRQIDALRVDVPPDNGQVPRAVRLRPRANTLSV